MITNSIEEDAKLDAMQRIWQTRRGISSSLFDTVKLDEEIEASIPTSPTTFCLPCENFNAKNDENNDIFEFRQVVDKLEKNSEKAYLDLDASKLGDLPARYKICKIKNHQFPVVGVYCDLRIVPGFKYRVRRLPKIGQDSTSGKCLFNGRALILNTIGRGFARRFTFEADKGKLNDNDNYFWSDSRPEGYAFELEVVSEGDKFTIFNLDNEAVGTLEVLRNEGDQIEISNFADEVNRKIEKRVKVKFVGKVEFYVTGVAKMLPVSGTAICVKTKAKNSAEISKITNVVIKKCKYVLRPGVDTAYRRVTVKGEDIADVPTSYTMTGLRNYEIPVVGTYIDPRIVPGFYYRVRPNDRKIHLFHGKTLKLLSIGMGYAKRLTFESESKIENNYFLWSDSHPDGLGLEPRAVHEGMKFKIYSNGEIIGEASVFRADKPQQEEKMEKVPTHHESSFSIEKWIHIDVMCHIKLKVHGRCLAESEQYLMRVYGLAVVRKEPKSLDSKVLRIEKIGLDSELEVLFQQTHTELLFLP